MVSLDVERNPKNVPAKIFQGVHTAFQLRFGDALFLKLCFKKRSRDF